jgi:predicted nucleic acid-binding protein
MVLMGVLVDSDVLIEILRGTQKALDRVARHLESGDRVCYSVITEAEILAGMRPGEEDAVDALLGSLEAMAVDRTIAQTAGSLKRKYGKSQGLLLPDAIIAATAIAHDLDLVTGNVKRFRFREVRIAT